jgi:hypothetical protein
MSANENGSAAAIALASSSAVAAGRPARAESLNSIDIEI